MKPKFRTDGPECPHCGHINDPFENPEDLFDEATGDVCCDRCHLRFHVEVKCTWSWNTRIYTESEAELVEYMVDEIDKMIAEELRAMGRPKLTLVKS